MLANIIVDLIILAIFVVAVILGVKRGFILFISKPVIWFAAVAIAFCMCTPFANYVVQPIIQVPITNQLSGYLTEKCADISAATANEQLPTLLKLAAGAVGIDVTAIDGDSSAEFISALVDKLAVPAIHLISVIISFFIMQIIAKVVLIIAFAIVNKMFSKGFFGAVNKVLGVVFNTAFAFIISWALVSLFGYVVNLPSVAQVNWVADFDGGFLYRLLKNISPIDLLLSF